MKIRTFAIFLERHRGAGTFDHTTAHRFEQRFDQTPFKVAVDGISEYRLQRFSLLAVHRNDYMTDCTICNQKASSAYFVNAFIASVNPCTVVGYMRSFMIFLMMSVEYVYSHERGGIGFSHATRLK